MKYHVFDEEIEINSETFEGFECLLQKFEPMIAGLLHKYDVRKNEEEDVRQEVAIILLNGFRVYDKKRGKLSTFLYIHLKNKFFELIRSSCAMKRNPSHLLDEEEFYTDTLSLDVILKSRDADGKLILDLIPSFSTLYLPRDDIALMDFRLSLDSALRSFDELTKEVVWGMLEDKSIKDFAKGISPWALSCRIKNISKSFSFEDLNYTPLLARNIHPKSYIKYYAPIV